MPRAEPNSYDVTLSEDVTHGHSCQHLKPYILQIPAVFENGNDQSKVQNEVEDGEVKSQPTIEAYPHHMKKAVHRYIEEM